MNYDSYKINSFPSTGRLLVDGSPALLNVIYSSDKELFFEKVEPTFSEPFTTFKLVTFLNGKESNVSTITINVPPNKSLVPQSNSIQKTISKNESLNFNDLLTFNKGVDRIKIVQFDNNQNDSILLDGQPIILGSTEILLTQLDKLVFTPNNFAIQEYSKQIKFVVGNNSQFNLTPYDIDLTIVIPVFIQETLKSPIFNVGNLKRVEVQYNLTNLPQNFTSADVSIKNNMITQFFNQDSSNAIYIRNGNTNIHFNNENEEKTFTTTTGEFFIVMEISSVDLSTYVSSLELKILSINNQIPFNNNSLFSFISIRNRGGGGPIDFLDFEDNQP